MMNKIDVTKVFSENEKSLMNAYVVNYAKEPHSPEMPSCSFCEVLDKEWAKEKYPFYKVFNEQLILSKEVEYSIASDELIARYNRLLDSPNNAIHDFYITITQLSNANQNTLRFEDSWGYIYNNIYQFIENRFLWRSDDLITGEWCGPVCNIPTPNGKIIKLEVGAKPMRILGKIVQAYNIPGFEEFRLEHSRILNTAKLKGTLCVSIHPLDYITMSENDSDWQSCMNWHDRGCYRRGTVEMMNSPYVIVAYLKGKEDMTRFGCKWNNKKWRQLFVVTDKIIAGIKSYPYYHEELSKEVATWLAEVFNAAGANYDITKCNTYNYNCEFYPISEDSNIPSLPIEFVTNAMYNDFECEDLSHVVICDKKYYNNPIFLSYNYSGASQCVFCGQIIADDWDESQEQLVCGDCGGKVFRCDGCNSSSYREELQEVDGQLFCNFCYERNTAIDAITRERHVIDSNLHNVTIITDTEYDTNFRYYYSVGIKTWTEINSPEWLAIFPRAQKAPCWFHEYYININDCSEEAKALINEYLPLTEYLERLNQIKSSF